MDMGGKMRRPVNMTEKEAAEWYLQHKVGHKNGCMLWLGYRGAGGYGQLSFQGDFWLAHRFIYHTKVDYLHKSEPVHHTCGNPSCVNPAHLQRITRQENTAEMLERGWYQSTIVHLQEQLLDLHAYIEHLEHKLEQT